MQIWILVFLGVLGAILGSFLNALSFRFNTGKTLGGRSRCMHCNHTLSAFDLIPILSYVFLRGRCRYCHARISIQYPLVEGAAALLAVGMYIVHPEPLAYGFWLLVSLVLLFIVVYDARHTIIPTSASVSLGILALLSLFIEFGEGISFMLPTLGEVLAGPLLALPLLLLSLVSGGKWMGWADSGLELSLGWLLGISLGATALMIAFWAGAFVGVFLILFLNAWQRGKKHLTMRSEVPFAPFLVFGALLAHFLHVNVFSTLLYLWQ